MQDDLLIEKPQDVIEVLNFVQNFEVNTGGRELINVLEGQIDTTRIEVLAKGVNAINWENQFLSIGNTSWKLLTSMAPLGKYATIFDRLGFAKFLLSKHVRYRLKPLLVWGELGVLIRLQSKVGRLVNITSNINLESKEEPPEKTVEDILGYCVLGYLLTKRLKGVAE